MAFGGLEDQVWRVRGLGPLEGLQSRSRGLGSGLGFRV